MRTALGLPALLLVGGCAVGEGKGALAGTLFIQSCTSDSSLGRPGAPAVYDMHPTFFVAEPIDDFPRPMPMNRLAIRMQPTGNRLEEADVLYLNTASVREVAQALGQPIDIGPSTNVRATLQLNATCPDRAGQAELDGTLTFTNFGQAAVSVPDDFRINFGDRLTASFVFDVVDRRALTLGGVGSVSPDPSVAGHLEGNFDFIVRQGRAAQSYP
jgi:hypothetical protein